MTTLRMLRWYFSPLELALLLPLAIAGCSAAPTPLQAAEAAAYGPLQAACVERGGTREQTDYCRDAVKAYYCGDGGLLAEAGACDGVRRSDGGRP